MLGHRSGFPLYESLCRLHTALHRSVWLYQGTGRPRVGPGPTVQPQRWPRVAGFLVSSLREHMEQCRKAFAIFPTKARHLPCWWLLVLWMSADVFSASQEQFLDWGESIHCWPLSSALTLWTESLMNWSSVDHIETQRLEYWYGMRYNSVCQNF